MFRHRPQSPLLAVGFVVILAPAASAKVAQRWNDLNLQPRVIRYDAEKDDFARQSSVLSMVSKSRRPGGAHSYSGSRLDQYRFHGKPGRGGIYDALDAYKKHLDPRNYEYRRW